MQYLQPVEKVVENIFFHLVYEANKDRSFAYAFLDGNAETAFGDAIALVEKVFVFEFKRNLSSVKDELGKFDCENERQFGEELILPYKANTCEALLERIHRAHLFVALDLSQKSALFRGPLQPGHLEVHSYLLRMVGDPGSRLTSKDCLLALKLDKTLGMNVDEACTYFDFLQSKKAKSSGGGNGDAAHFACCVIDTNGNIGVVLCQGLEGVVNALVEVKKYAAVQPRPVSAPAHSGSSPSMGG